jgi:5-methylcytosine-specific restriction protein A
VHGLGTQGRRVVDLPWAPKHPCSKCGRATDKRFCDRCAPQVERAREQNEPWRAWYRTPRWKALRWEVLTEAMFRCQCEECKGEKVWPKATVVDHVEPHRGDETKFWSGPFKAMAKRCHDAKTARETNERRR